MEQIILESEKKNKTLASWTKDRVEKLSQIKGKWDNFKYLMENHEQIVSMQVSNKLKNSNL